MINRSNGNRLSVTTDSAGRYSFSSLSQAKYDLSITSPGFARFEETGITLLTSKPTVVSATLKVGAATATVQVAAADPTSYVAVDTSAATRTDTPLIQVPQSVGILTQGLLVEQDARSLNDALVNVSGVTPTKPEEVLFTQPIVRGFPAEVYWDGLPTFGFTTTNNDPTSLVDAERIEVLKGPTSTVYGGGVGAPLGGLINVVSKRPEPDFGGFVGMRGGSFSTLDPYTDINIQAGSAVSARVTGEYQRNESWIDQVHGERWSAEPSVLFRLDPQTELLVRGEYNRRAQLEYSGLPADAALAGQLNRNSFPGVTSGQSRTRNDNSAETVELRHRVNDNVHWTLTGRYYDNATHEYGSFTYPVLGAPDPATPTAYPIFTIYLPGKLTEASVDAYLVANLHGLGGRHELLGGFDYDHTNFEGDLGFTGVPVGTLDLARPTYNLQYGDLPPVTTFQTNRYSTLAGYAQDQATYGRLHLLGSVRLTRFGLAQVQQAYDTSYVRANPRVGGTFDIIPGVALYGAFATGFRGAVNFIGETTPKPETSRNEEGGVKLALTRIGLSGTVAAFQQIRRNVSNVDPNNPLFTIQVGEQRARGVEADATWEPVRAFSLLANYAYNGAEVTASQDPGISVGARLPRVPRHSGRLLAYYRVQNGFAKGLSFGVGSTAFSRRDIYLPNSGTTPGYATIDAHATYTYGRYTLEASADNLADHRAFDPYAYLVPVVIPNQPRSAYLSFKTTLGRK